MRNFKDVLTSVLLEPKDYIKDYIDDAPTVRLEKGEKMNDLVKRRDVLDNLRKIKWSETSGEYHRQRAYRSVIKAVSKKTYREVVLCKDCKFWDVYEDFQVIGGCNCEDSNRNTRDVDFCSWGERKEDAKID